MERVFSLRKIIFLRFCDDYNGFAISENVPYLCLPRCGGKMSSSNSTENKLYVYSLSAFCQFSATVLVTLSMLTNRVGCYNVREKKLIVHRLTPTVNSYGIATFPVFGEGIRF